MAMSGRTPQGVRGLESFVPYVTYALIASHPARGAWIEIRPRCGRSQRGGSHPARGAWIEITEVTKKLPEKVVAPRKGCVD